MVLSWEKIVNGTERDVWSNHYIPSSLKPEHFLNPFNSTGESARDFVWETKSISNQNST